MHQFMYHYYFDVIKFAFTNFFARQINECPLMTKTSTGEKCPREQITETENTVDSPRSLRRKIHVTEAHRINITTIVEILQDAVFLT